MRLYRNPLVLTLIVISLTFLSIAVIFNDSHNYTNSITGHDIVNTKVEVFPTIIKSCSFRLYSGWNLVSFYCLGLYSDRSEVLQSIENSYGAIFEYNSFDSADPWKSYNSSLPNWTVQQLTNMDRISGYWVYMYNDTDFNYQGVYSNSIILLNNGWNLVGYPNTLTTNITTGLNGVPFTVVENYINTNITYSNCVITLVTDNNTNITTNVTTCDSSVVKDTWLVHVNGGSANTLNDFNTYKGYWVNVTGGSQWNIAR